MPNIFPKVENLRKGRWGLILLKYNDKSIDFCHRF